MSDLTGLVTEHLISSVKECFSVTIGVELSESDNIQQPFPGNCLICSVSFTGDLEGSVAVIVIEKVACFTVGKMLSMEFSQIDADVKDGFNEVGNMITGGLKNRLSQDGLSCNISVPTAIEGKNLELSFPRNVIKIFKSFKGNDVDFGVIVDFKVAEKKEGLVIDQLAQQTKDNAMARLKAMVKNSTNT